MALSDENKEVPPFVLSDKQYGLLKWIVTIVLPAVGTLYFALSKLWNLPGGESVLGTLIALQAFLGVLLGISTQTYKNSDARFSGDINIIKHEDGEKSASIDFNQHPTELDEKDEAVFRVNSSKK